MPETQSLWDDFLDPQSFGLRPGRRGLSSRHIYCAGDFSLELSRLMLHVGLILRSRFFSDADCLPFLLEASMRSKYKPLMMMLRSLCKAVSANANKSGVSRK